MSLSRQISSAQAPWLSAHAGGPCAGGCWRARHRNCSRMGGPSVPAAASIIRGETQRWRFACKAASMMRCTQSLACHGPIRTCIRRRRLPAAGAYLPGSTAPADHHSCVDQRLCRGTCRAAIRRTHGGGRSRAHHGPVGARRTPTDPCHKALSAREPLCAHSLEF